MLVPKIAPYKREGACFQKNCFIVKVEFDLHTGFIAQNLQPQSESTFPFQYIIMYTNQN